MGRWKACVEELENKENMPAKLYIERECEFDEDNLGPELLDSEIEKSLSEMKANKAVGQIRNIPVQLLKGLGTNGKKTFFGLCRNIYEEGVRAEGFARSVFIPIPKKNKTTKCEDYRTIRFYSHAEKIVIRAVSRRLEKRANEFLGEDQFGLRRGRGTRDAIAVIRTMIERNIEHNTDVYARDRVKWPSLMNVLEKIGVDWREKHLIGNLYMNLSAKVRVADGESEWTVLDRGVS